jgi:hypothetical protein
MLEPQKFVASTESLRVNVSDGPNEDTLPVRPIIGDNPLNAFETYHLQVKTDLDKWMTYSAEDRFRRAKVFAAGGQNGTKVDEDKRAKILNYIIWLESHHVSGDSMVAAIAFNGLFPGHKDRLKANART